MAHFASVTFEIFHIPPAHNAYTIRANDKTPHQTIQSASQPASQPQPIYMILFYAFVFLNRKWCLNNANWLISHTLCLFRAKVNLCVWQNQNTWNDFVCNGSSFGLEISAFFLHLTVITMKKTFICPIFFPFHAVIVALQKKNTNIHDVAESYACMEVQGRNRARKIEE